MRPSLQADTLAVSAFFVPAVGVASAVNHFLLRAERLFVGKKLSSPKIVTNE
jgi:hypothetical protein